MKTIVSSPSTSTEREDIREQLLNEGRTGHFGQIQVSTERIVKLRGILFDIDPGLLRPGILLGQISLDPVELYEQTVKLWLQRHPALRGCEVRVSGTGLHVILRFDEPVNLEQERDLKRWKGIVKVVQAALPIAPDQPGITACTRALGSINGKNGAEVLQLTAGQPVAEEHVLELYEQMSSAPFRTVLEIVTGRQQVSPCPVCGQHDRTLKAQDYIGFCYGSCGRVTLDELYHQMLHVRGEEEGCHANS